MLETLQNNKKITFSLLIISAAIVEPDLFLETLHFVLEHIFEAIELLFEFVEAKIDGMIEILIGQPFEQRFMQALAFSVTLALFVGVAWLLWVLFLERKCLQCLQHCIAKLEECRTGWQKVCLFARSYRFLIATMALLLAIFYLTL